MKVDNSLLEGFFHVSILHTDKNMGTCAYITVVFY